MKWNDVPKILLPIIAGVFIGVMLAEYVTYVVAKQQLAAQNNNNTTTNLLGLLGSLSGKTS